MRIKKILKEIISGLYSIPFRFGNTELSLAFFERFCVAFNKYTNYYSNFTIYPKNCDEIAAPVTIDKTIPKTAIVLQGIIVEKDNFTVETVKLYKKIFPDSYIIVSTWNGVKESTVHLLEKIGAIVVLSPEPEYSGIGNINYQVTNTLAGVKKAQNLGANYVIKTRTDQRIHKKNLLIYLFNLLDEYPISYGFEEFRQNDRIIVLQGTAVAPSMFVAGYISDFFYFGEISDILNYFSFPLQDFTQSYEERRKWLKNLRKEENLQDYFSKSAPEVMLYKSYLSRNYKNFDDTLETYWTYLANYMIGISWYDLGLYWNKYDSFLQTNKIYGHFDHKDTEERLLTYGLDFSNWLMLYKNELKASDFVEYSRLSAKIIE